MISSEGRRSFKFPNPETRTLKIDKLDYLKGKFLLLKKLSSQKTYAKKPKKKMQIISHTKG